jgi:hypothetical protein
VFVACLLVVVAGESKWVLAYAIYGLLSIVTVIIPTILAYVFGRIVPFPTFGLTLMYLGDRQPLTARAISNVTRLLRLR